MWCPCFVRLARGSRRIVPSAARLSLLEPAEPTQRTPRSSVVSGDSTDCCIENDVRTAAGRVGTASPLRSRVHGQNARPVAPIRVAIVADVLLGEMGGVSRSVLAYRAVSARTDPIDRLDLRTRVQIVGHVPDDALPSLYASADAFALRSLHEGFGLPVLEAMASGTPVHASNLSALPEVCATPPSWSTRTASMRSPPALNAS